MNCALYNKIKNCLNPLHCRHQIQAGHSIGPHHEAGMENRIQVLKGPFNILQLAQDKRQFPSPGLFTFYNTS